MINYKRFKEEKGSSNSVAFLFILFVISIMLISFIDVGLYFNVKNQVQDAAENGARNVALYGGTGSTNALRKNVSNTDAVDVVYNSIPETFKSTSANPVKIIGSVSSGKNDKGRDEYNNSQYGIRKGDITCGTINEASWNVAEGNTKSAGDPVGCEISFGYRGIAGKLGMFQIAGKEYKVIGTSVSEVSTK